MNYLMHRRVEDSQPAFTEMPTPVTYECWLIARFVSSRLTPGELCSMQMSSHDVPGARWMCRRTIEECKILK